MWDFNFAKTKLYNYKSREHSDREVSELAATYVCAYVHAFIGFI